MKNKLLFTLAIMLASVFAQAQYTLTISDVVFSDGEIAEYTNTIEKDIIIPETLNGQAVTSIGEYVFSFKQLTGVIIPNSVISIGVGAFVYNPLITSVIIPSSVTFIGADAFSSNQLTSVVIPNSVTSIEPGVFSGNQLTSVTIPNSITSIGGHAFEDNKLTGVTIPNSVTEIYYNAFTQNKLTNVIIPNSVTYIGRQAFYENKLTSVIIPSSVTYIGDTAFEYNPLTSIKLPIAEKEGHIFENWNGNIAGNTEVTNLEISYSANFTENLSITNSTLLQNTKIYPNPTKGKITIEVDNLKKLQVYNLLGVLVSEKQASGNSVVLNLQGNNPGVYLVKIYTDNGVVVRRIVVEQ